MVAQHKAQERVRRWAHLGLGSQGGVNRVGHLGLGSQGGGNRETFLLTFDPPNPNPGVREGSSGRGCEELSERPLHPTLNLTLTLALTLTLTLILTLTLTQRLNARSCGPTRCT